jgi:hypothetical protein
MPVSRKRKKTKSSHIHEKVTKPIKESPASQYVDDFLDDVVDSLENGDFGLVSVVRDVNDNPDHEESFRHYYVLSRNSDGKLLEHNEGPAFRRRFVNILQNNGTVEENPVKVVVGYFKNDQVKTIKGGIDFLTPYYAIQWKVAESKFLPDPSEYNWNGYMVQPGGQVSRSF